MGDAASFKMSDCYSKETRSRVMRSVKGKDTKPELLLRRTLWSIGVRGYRIHRKDIYGRPDLAFIRSRVAVFVDGGFWHGHPSRFSFGRSGEYWDAKIRKNMERDLRVNEELTKQGWEVVRLWDFEVLKDPVVAANLISSRVSARLSLDKD